MDWDSLEETVDVEALLVLGPAFHLDVELLQGVSQ